MAREIGKVRLTWALLGALGLVGCSSGQWKNPFSKSGTKTPNHGGGEATAEYRLFDGGFSMAIETYADCSALQKDVYDQLVKRRDNEQRRDLYYRAMAESARQSYSRSDSYAKGAMPMPVNQSSSSSGAAADGASESAAPASEEGSFTNVQVEGVDEADTVKIARDYILVGGVGTLSVVDRASLELIGELPWQNDQSSQLFASGDKLVHLSSDGTAVKVDIYQSKAKAMPELIKTHELKGRYLDARFTEGRLVLVLQDTLPTKPIANGNGAIEPMAQTDMALRDAMGSFAAGGAGAMPGYAGPDYPLPEITSYEIDENPVVVDDGDLVAGVACSSIAKPTIGDLDFGMTKVLVVNVTDPAQDVEAAAQLGGGDQIYMSRDALYISKHGLSWYPWFQPEDQETANRYGELMEALVVTKVAFGEDGAARVKARGLIRGYAKDQWAYRDYPEVGALVVATTTNMPLGVEAGEPAKDPAAGRNQLWVLKDEGTELKVHAGVHNFGEPGEDIRSVRFLGDYAYVVTFKKTDPLYAIDLSDPLAPRLAGQLKVPGFSMYLHPVADHQLLGVGFDADDQGSFAWYQGIQVSLFDIANPEAMERTDNHLHGARGSYSDVTSDHHAFFYNAEDNLLAIPLVEIGKAGESSGPNMGQTLEFSGAVLYAIEGDKLVERGRISHKDLIPAECQGSLSQGQWWQNQTRSLDVNRVYKVDGSLLSVSRFGIMRHDLAEPSHVIKKLSLPRKEPSPTNGAPNQTVSNAWPGSGWGCY